MLARLSSRQFEELKLFFQVDLDEREQRKAEREEANLHNLFDRLLEQHRNG